MRVRKLLLAVAALAVLIAAILAAAFRLPGRAEPAAERTELLVAAAASLQGSLDEVLAAYEANRPGVAVTVTYGSSGALKHQIAHGAPADLFIFADTLQSDELVEQELADNVRVLLSNRLVLVVPSGAAEASASLGELKDSGVRRIAIGQPETVPAGRYAAEALEAAGIREAVADKLIYGKDVRQVLAYVETGNADAGLVYRSDALGSAKARMVQELAQDLHGPIRYPAGVVRTTANRTEAERLLDYLGSDGARTTFRSYGFEPAGQ